MEYDVIVYNEKTCASVKMNRDSMSHSEAIVFKRSLLQGYNRIITLIRVK